MPLSTELSTVCSRCGSSVAYAGQPCTLCLSGALFAFKNGEAAEIQGALRGTGPKARSSTNRSGKRIRVPLSRRAISALHTFSMWTLTSLTYAFLAHLLMLAILLLVTPLSPFTEQLSIRVTPEMTSMAPPAPIDAPAPVDSLLPSPDDETTISTENIFTERRPGMEDFVPPNDDPVFAPEPAIAPPMPNRAVELPRVLKGNNVGLGQGRDSDGRSPNFGGGGLYRNRKGDSRNAALKRHGGDSGSENAVNLGLKWLAEVQSSDGSWDPTGGDDSRFASGINESWGGEMRLPVSALCLLPFLAAGNSTIEGDYASNVDRAVTWLMRQQQSSGCFGSPYSGQQMYAHGVATLAMCEAFGLSGDEKIKRSAERGVRFLERSQSSKGGWDYRAQITASRGAGKRNDLSISGWAVLALKSARAVGISVNGACWHSLTELYDGMSLDTGETYYSDETPYSFRKGIAMTGVGLMARTILDREKFTAKNAAAIRLLSQEPPKWENFDKPHNGSADPNFESFYGWYNGTLGLFMATDGAGPDWEKWNTSLKATLIENQELEVEEHRGSWDPADPWIGKVAGRLYSTACSILCLEVYYRYATTRLVDAALTKGARETAPPEASSDVKKPAPPADDGSDMARPGNRAKALRALVKDKGLAAIPAVIDAFKDASSTVKFTALSLAADLKAKDAAQPLLEMLGRSENIDLRSTIAWALGCVGDERCAGALIGLLADNDKTTSEAARSALVALSGGKDFGINAAAWRAHFRK